MIRLLFAILLLLAGCGNESVNEAKPSPGDVSYSSSPEINPFVVSSDSAEPVASSSSEVVIEESSSGLQLSSLAVESSSFSLITSSSEDMEWSSSSMSQGCTGPACYLYSSSSSSSSSIKVVYGEMTDERDGQTYKTVKVNDNVTWMAENLNYAYLQPTAELDSSSWCGDFWNEDGCDVYGRLYLWSAAVDSAALFSDAMKGCGYYESSENWQKCPLDQNVRGVCPEGWKLPTYDDYINLMSWRVSYPPINFKEEQLGDFIKLKNNYYASTYFWLVTEKDFARGFLDRYSETSLEYSEGASIIDLRITEKKEFHTVRCVKDEEMNEE